MVRGVVNATFMMRVTHVEMLVPVPAPVPVPVGGARVTGQRAKDGVVKLWGIVGTAVGTSADTRVAEGAGVGAREGMVCLECEHGLWAALVGRHVPTAGQLVLVQGAAVKGVTKALVADVGGGEGDPAPVPVPVPVPLCWVGLGSDGVGVGRAEGWMESHTGGTDVAGEAHGGFGGGCGGSAAGAGAGGSAVGCKILNFSRLAAAATSGTVFEPVAPGEVLRQLHHHHQQQQQQGTARAACGGLGFFVVVGVLEVCPGVGVAHYAHPGNEGSSTDDGCGGGGLPDPHSPVDAGEWLYLTPLPGSAGTAAVGAGAVVAHGRNSPHKRNSCGVVVSAGVGAIASASAGAGGAGGAISSYATASLMCDVRGATVLCADLLRRPVVCVLSRTDDVGVHVGRTRNAQTTAPQALVPRFRIETVAAAVDAITIPA